VPGVDHRGGLLLAGAASGRDGEGDATVRFDIWGYRRPGEVPQPRRLAPMYYRRAAAAVVVYDISSLVRETSSFRSVMDVL
jgi:hypothetical protein